MGASIEEDYLFELLSWTPARPHIHIHMRTHGHASGLAMHELDSAVNTWIGQCSEVSLSRHEFSGFQTKLYSF